MRVDHFLSSTGIRHVYHFTDEMNLPLIRRHGLRPQTDLAKLGITCPRPGGSDQSRMTDAAKGFGDYVHLCFKDEHPMEWVARQEGRLGQTRFLQVDARVLLRQGALGCAELVNANGAQVLPLSDALDIIDCDVLFGGQLDFGNHAWLQRWNEARKAEILIPGAIPTELIANLEDEELPF